MKKATPGILGLALIVAMLITGFPSSQAGTIVWTNTLGGNWSAATNWSPNAIPSESDNVYISADGTYDVSLDTSTSVSNLVVGGGSSGAQIFHTGTSALVVNGACVINGNGVFDLEGGSLSGPGAVTIYGAFNWDGGSLGNGETVSVEPDGAMVLENGNDALYGALTNAGTIALVGGNLQLLGACFDNNGMLINLTNGLVEFQGDVSIRALCGTEAITNYGTILKTNTAGISDISAPFYNMGTLDVESGTVSLDSTCDLTNGIINFGISNQFAYGTLAFTAGPAQLAGTISATLVGDYQPIATNEFDVITYTAESGVFTNTNLPYLDAWQTNYGVSVFALTVLNARPMIYRIPNAEVQEFSTLALDATATDADQPPQALTFSLSNAPAGMTINPGTGLLNWSPAQTQSPSTNTVTVIVTDNGTPPLSTNTNFTVVVLEQNIAPAWPAVGVETVNESALLTVDEGATEKNIHGRIAGYSLINPPAGAAINSNGVVTWTPSQAQSPSTNIIVTAVTNIDPLDMSLPILVATNNLMVIVFAPALSPIQDYSVNVGQTLTFTNFGADNDPTRTLTFSMVSGPPSASVGGASGIFAWQPGSNYNATANSVTIQVADNNVPPLTANQSFLIYVGDLARPPSIGTPRFSGGQFQFQVSGPVGPTYYIEAAAALPSAQWTNLQTIIPTTTPFLFTDTNTPQAERIYRVELIQ
jgi:hypothetical protein